MHNRDLLHRYTEHKNKDGGTCVCILNSPGRLSSCEIWSSPHARRSGSIECGDAARTRHWARLHDYNDWLITSPKPVRVARMGPAPLQLPNGASDGGRKVSPVLCISFLPRTPRTSATAVYSSVPGFHSRSGISTNYPEPLSFGIGLTRLAGLARLYCLL